MPPLLFVMERSERRLRGEDFRELARYTAANARRFFACDGEDGR